MKATTCGSCEYFDIAWGLDGCTTYCTNPNSLEYHEPISEFHEACKEMEDIKDVD